MTIFPLLFPYAEQQANYELLTGGTGKDIGIDCDIMIVQVTISLPIVVKSIIDGEATDTCSRQVIRGAREQRASRVKPGTWEVPSDGLVGGNKRPRPIEQGNESPGRVVWEVGWGHSSVDVRVMPTERRVSGECLLTLNERRTAWKKFPLRNRQTMGLIFSTRGNRSCRQSPN